MIICASLIQDKIEESPIPVPKEKIPTSNFWESPGGENEDPFGTENDDHTNHDKILDFETGVHSHNENMQRFVKNYGIKIAIPGFYIQCAKFYPRDPGYVV